MGWCFPENRAVLILLMEARENEQRKLKEVQDAFAGVNVRPRIMFLGSS
jgi:hypothetical protein